MAPGKRMIAPSTRMAGGAARDEQQIAAAALDDFLEQRLDAQHAVGWRGGAGRGVQLADERVDVVAVSVIPVLARPAPLVR